MNIIAAVDANWAIGKDGDQLCYIRADLKRFQALTTGHGVILGRKTLATFPGGRPLGGRENIVLSRQEGLVVPGAKVVHSMEEALAVCGEDTFVIGGGSVYAAALPWCDTAYITKLAGAWEADTWFPDLDADGGWRLAETSAPMEEKGVGYTFCRYERVWKVNSESK